MATSFVARASVKLIGMERSSVPTPEGGRSKINMGMFGAEWDIAPKTIWNKCGAQKNRVVQLPLIRMRK